METRREKTLPRTLNFSSACAKITFIAILFIPPVLTVQYAVPRVVDRQPLLPDKSAEKKWPKELAVIHSIVKLNQPDIADREAWKLSTAILDECAKRNLDPMLVLAVIKVESGFRNHALSPMGARGIMQIMPETGKFLSEELLRVDGFEGHTFTPEHLYDPVLSIKLGVYYLEGLKRQFGNLQLALLAYNFGPGEIQNRLDNNIHFPEEYAAAVLNIYREFKKARAPLF
jgi:soluble lytic murein transglycosylase-like protein